MIEGILILLVTVLVTAIAVPVSLRSYRRKHANQVLQSAAAELSTGQVIVVTAIGSLGPVHLLWLNRQKLGVYHPYTDNGPLSTDESIELLPRNYPGHKVTITRNDAGITTRVHTGTYWISLPWSMTITDIIHRVDDLVPNVKAEA